MIQDAKPGFKMIDHANVLPRILEKLFPGEDGRAEVLEILEHYGHAPFQPEKARVRMAILKLAGRSPERIRYFTLQACRDYRDVLSAAEYPGQAGHWNLRKKDPARYERLVQEDLEQYRLWYLGILWEGEAGEQ